MVALVEALAAEQQAAEAAEAQAGEFGFRPQAEFLIMAVLSMRALMPEDPIPITKELFRADQTADSVLTVELGSLAIRRLQHQPQKLRQANF